MKQKISLGDFIIGFVLGVEMVLFERSERVVLIAASDDLLMRLHSLICYNNFVFIRLDENQNQITEKCLKV
jgi:hypothetical protein